MDGNGAIIMYGDLGGGRGATVLAGVFGAYRESLFAGVTVPELG